VWYKVVGDAEHSDSQPQSIPVTIAEAPAYAVTIDDAGVDASNWQATPAEPKTGQTVTLSYSGKKKIRSITIEKAAAEPSVPTLAATMTTAGMTVKVNFNYDGENYCQFLSNGDGTYTFQSGGGNVGGTADMAKALVVENGKLVFKQNEETTIDENWDWCGYSVTFDTSNNTYTQWAAELIQETYSPSFTSVEVNGTTIALQSKIAVDDLVKEEYQYWNEIAVNNEGKIYIDDFDYVRRCSDGAKLLQRAPDDEEWSEVDEYNSYYSDYSYKFEGD
jgi:hypothetical protein